MCPYKDQTQWLSEAKYTHSENGKQLMDTRKLPAVVSYMGKVRVIAYDSQQRSLSGQNLACTGEGCSQPECLTTFSSYKKKKVSFKA